MVPWFNGGGEICSIILMVEVMVPYYNVWRNILLKCLGSVINSDTVVKDCAESDDDFQGWASDVVDHVIIIFGIAYA